MKEQTLVWLDGTGLTPAAPLPDAALLAADSWLVHDGRVRALDRHRRRFAAACAEATGEPEARIEAFLDDVVDALPREGRWFPRVELIAIKDAGRFRLSVRIRRAPPPAVDVAVLLTEEPDPRAHPRRKGPDLGLLAKLRWRAAEKGATETLLTTPLGLVLEGATSNILWWEDETLCLPPPELPVLAGVTTALIQEHAAERGVAVVHRRAYVRDLHGREVWLVNALHGIRPVTAWLGRSLRPGPARHAARWQTWLGENSDVMAATAPTNGVHR